jgi:hypothetical protein
MIGRSCKAAAETVLEVNYARANSQRARFSNVQKKSPAKAGPSLGGNRPIERQRHDKIDYDNIQLSSLPLSTVTRQRETEGFGALCVCRQTWGVLRAYPTLTISTGATLPAGP